MSVTALRWLALAGGVAGAQGLANDLNVRFPDDTFVKFTDLPTLRALFALNRGSASEALNLLHIAAPRDLVVQGGWFASFGNVYTAYVRGVAWIAAKQGPEAATEFQKVLDHPGVVLDDPVAIAARLQLARALALSGHRESAIVAYRNFLTLWTHADAGIPILEQAKAEYALLR